MVKEVTWTLEAELRFFKVIEYLKSEWSDREVENFVSETDR